MNVTLYGSTQSRLPWLQRVPSQQAEREAQIVLQAEGRGGVHVLSPHSSVRLPGAARPLPVRRYRDAVQWLLAHRERLAKSTGSAAFLVGWIFDPRSGLALFAPSLEAEGLPLRNVVFLESHMSAPTLQSACELDAFQAIVVEGTPSAVELQVARRWTKPAALRASEGDAAPPCASSPHRARNASSSPSSPFHRSLGASASGALGTLAASTCAGSHGVLRADALLTLSREKCVLFLA